MKRNRIGWDKGGRYSTRSKRENGRECARIAQDMVAALAAPLAEFEAAANLPTEAVLLAAGCRRHNRGEWRKRRGHAAEAE